MNDCSNANIRDRLPDLLHDRLDVSVRASVEAHVSNCADCRDEMGLLRQMHAVLILTTPPIDVSHVVSALPRPGAVGPATLARRAGRQWQVAAAVVCLALGAGSVARYNRNHQSTIVGGEARAVPITGHAEAPAPRGPAVAAQDAQPVPSTSNTAISRSAGAPAIPLEEQAVADLAPGGRLANLNRMQLKQLLADIDNLPATPVTESAPVTIGVAGVSPAPEGS